LAKRHAGPREARTVAARLDRADLDGELQVGATNYTDSQPALVVRYDGLGAEALGADEAC